MKGLYYFLITTLTLSISCESQPNLEEECPYDFMVQAHLLKVPIEVSPHRMNYSVGDTIVFLSEFSDSIVDVGDQETFLIRDFPFEPVSYLYRFYDDDFSYDAGYTVNTHIVEDKYDSITKMSSERIDWFWAKMIYNDGIYHFDHKLILEKPGKYIMLTVDVFNIRNESNTSAINDSIRAIEFEGKCNLIPFDIVSVIEGEDHMEEFMDELLYLDNNVYRGNLASTDQGITGLLGSVSVPLEFSGFYSFEVTE